MQQGLQQQQQRPAWARRPVDEEPCRPAAQQAAQPQAAQQRPQWDVRNLGHLQGWSQPASRAPSRGASRRQAGSASLVDSQPAVVPSPKEVAGMPAAGSSGTSGASIGAHTWGPARILQRHVVQQTESFGTIGATDDSGGLFKSLLCCCKEHIVSTGCTAGWMLSEDPGAVYESGRAYEMRCTIALQQLIVPGQFDALRRDAAAVLGSGFWQHSMLLFHTVH